MGYIRRAFPLVVVVVALFIAIATQSHNRHLVPHQLSILLERLDIALHNTSSQDTQPQQQKHMLASLARKMASQQAVESAQAAGNAAATGAAVGATRAPLSRSVVKKVYAVETPEGAGAVVRRSIGTPQLRNLSPFLMLDNFLVKPGAGFPDHPHRGQSTVTYMLEGEFEHEDSQGHKGRVGPSDLQWMIAGRGIVHAEMPRHYDDAGKRLPDPVGLQLWIDLPKAHKMDAPSYQELSSTQIPTARPRPDEPVETEGSGWTVKVIAGQSHGVESPVRTPSKGGCWYLDVTLAKPGDRIFQEIPTGFNAFIYTLGPAPIRVGDAAGPGSQVHERHHTLVLSNQAQISDPRIDPASVPQENGVWIEHAGADGAQEARLVVIAGEPLDQPVFQHGPFVMTSREEIMKTFMDYQSGTNGFENAPGWRSKIGQRM